MAIDHFIDRPHTRPALSRTQERPWSYKHPLVGKRVMIHDLPPSEGAPYLSGSRGLVLGLDESSFWESAIGKGRQVLEQRACHAERVVVELDWESIYRILDRMEQRLGSRSLPEQGLDHTSVSERLPELLRGRLVQVHPRYLLEVGGVVSDEPRAQDLEQTLPLRG